MEELIVVLNRRDDPSSTGLGFSLLDKPGFPPVIYDIEENSPAAESGKVEAGDVILKVNDIDVVKFSIKEVLKCLRLAGNPVVLKLKRDACLKERILHYLSSTMENDENDLLGRDEIILTNGSDMLHTSHKTTYQENVNSHSHTAPLKDVTSSRKFENKSSSSVCKTTNVTTVSSSNNTSSQQPMFEAYVMTGERVLKLTKNPSLMPKYQKKIDSLKSQNCRRNANSQNYKIKSTPSSPVESSSLSDSYPEPKSSSANTSPITVGAPLPMTVTDPSLSPLPVRQTSSSSSSSSTATTEDHTALLCNSPFLENVSKSDEHIQYRKSSSVSSISVQVNDDDLTCSLHTLLDTTSNDNKTEDKRILWTYNAPHKKLTQSSSTSTMESSENISSQPSISPPSPTSLSSSVVSPVSCSSSSCYSTSSSFSSSSSSTTTTTDGRRSQITVSSSINNSSQHLQNQHRRHHYHCHYHNDDDDNDNNNNYNNRIKNKSNSHNNNNDSSINNDNIQNRINKNFKNSNDNSSVDSSQMEILSNISSPDYQEETSDLLNSNDMGMEVTDPSDSDSTLLVSEPKIRRLNKSIGIGFDNYDLSDGTSKNSTVYHSTYSNNISEDKSSHPTVKQTLSECDDELIALTEGAVNLAKSISPPNSSSSEEESGSDVESLHSFHYSPKGVDYPSAHRLAKRLYHLDGFKKSDVSRHLSKNNEFNRAVAEEYLKHFNFINESLEEALRKFLKQFSLSGESQERERVLVHFSKRYLDCNPGSFYSQDAVHTLTCAIMLLNNDLHDQSIRRKMTCNAFIENLSGLNDGGNFPREILKSLYQAIKNTPLEWAVDDEADESLMANNLSMNGRLEQQDGQNEFVSDYNNMSKVQESNGASTGISVIDYKKGYVLRKCCYEANGKRTPLGKRGWKLLFCTLRDLVLFLHKDDQELSRNQTVDTTSHNIIRLHHALATKATDYEKKQFVFRLQTADRAEYLFQTSDHKELQSWIDTINLVCASFSAPALPEPVGSQKKFQRPLLPSAPSKLNLKDQLKEHERMVEELGNELETHRKHVPDKSAKNIVMQNYKEKEAYLVYEIKRYKTYVYLLQSKLPQIVNSMDAVPLAPTEIEEENVLNGTVADDEEEEEEEETEELEDAGRSPMPVNRKSSKKS